MPEGVADGGRVTGTGHGPRISTQRPDGIPGDWVRDRTSKQWRPPRRPGPKPAEPDPGAGDGGGWQAERDPGAARLRDDHDSGSSPPPGASSPPPGEVSEDLAAAMGLVGMIVLPVGERIDPYCGAALTSCWGRVSEACVPLLMRSERVVKFMTTAGGIGDWFGLALALKPVGEAIVKHHITKTVQIVQDEGGNATVTEDAGYDRYPAAA